MKGKSSPKERDKNILWREIKSRDQNIDHGSEKYLGNYNSWLKIIIKRRWGKEKTTKKDSEETMKKKKKEKTTKRVNWKKRAQKLGRKERRKWKRE